MNKHLFYDSIAKDFDSVMNMYDTNKRVSVVFDELLTENIKGKKLLDAGCGTGWFSQRACERGAQVTSMDVGKSLLKEVAKKCNSTRLVGSILEIPFENNTFDVVVSSEVIEHTDDPIKAISELGRVLKKGGILVLTTPNSFWYWSVVIANVLHLRPYQGVENWIGWGTLRNSLAESQLKIIKEQGVHAFPFVLKATYPALDYLDSYKQQLKPYMVNMAVKCKKL